MKKKAPFVTCLMLGIILFCGCQKASILTPNRRSIAIDGLVILNATAQALQDVELKVGNTNRLVKCSYIPAGGKFSTAFPLKTYQGNPVVSSWSNHLQQRFSSPPTYAQPPERIDYERTYQAVVVIQSSGKVEIYLQANQRR
jgi:hypothetical protein